MDDQRFDAFAKSLGTILSRRGLSRLLGGLSLGGALGAAGVREAGAAFRKGGARCTTNRQCRSGRCAGPAGNKRCRCTRAFPVCKQPANRCKRAVCDVTSGRCQVRNKRNGIACGDGKKCCRGTCIDTNSDPRNCGACGTRCQLNAICSDGTCTCVRGTCNNSGATCCSVDSARAEVCRCSSAINPGTCETEGNVDLCPAGTVPCVGPVCAACCPANSTCDPGTGTCLRT